MKGHREEVRCEARSEGENKPWQPSPGGHPGWFLASVVTQRQGNAKLIFF